MSNISTQRTPETRRLRAGLARYRQVYISLKNQIIDGIVSTGQPLPSEPELALQFGVSRITIRHALGLLEAEDLVTRRHGVGTFVNPPSPVQPGGPQLHGPLENLITLGVKTTAELLSTDWILPNAAHRSALEVVEGDKIFRLTRKRSADGEPFSYSSIFLRRDTAKLLELKSLGDEPVIAALEAVGVKASHADQGLGATLAELITAEALSVDVGAPLTRLRRVVYDAVSRPILYQVSLYRPDRFEYRMTLNRTQDGCGPSWRGA